MVPYRVEGEHGFAVDFFNDAIALIGLIGKMQNDPSLQHISLFHGASLVIQTACLHAHVCSFAQKSVDEILGQLTRSHVFALEGTQRDAWRVGDHPILSGRIFWASRDKFEVNSAGDAPMPILGCSRPRREPFAPSTARWRWCARGF